MRSGVALMYADDNLPKDLTMRHSDFGARTFKLPTWSNYRVLKTYTLRAAAELFIAAAAPGGFYGNSFSTFSNGVALLRRFGGNQSTLGGTFSYDCGSKSGGHLHDIYAYQTVNESRCHRHVGGPPRLTQAEE